MIDDENRLCKQLLIVCSHNIAIGWYFDKDPEGIYVGFPHFGPLSTKVPMLRTLARFWSYEMVAIRAATALRPVFIPGLWASFMSLIIPQMAVFATEAIGSLLGTDYWGTNPISYASVNGFPCLIWLIWFLVRHSRWEGWKDFIDLWVVSRTDVNVDWIAVGLLMFPFVSTLVYKIVSSCFFHRRLTQINSKAMANGRTFFVLSAVLNAPLFFYLLFAQWELADVNKVMYGYASIMIIFWVNVLGGVDLWIEEPLGYPARAIAFTPTWIVSHGVYFLQWALDPYDYINRAVFVFYMLPQLVHLNNYFRLVCSRDWFTQGTILLSYAMHAHMTAVEFYRCYLDIMDVGLKAIGEKLVQDCPLHFTPFQFAVVCLILIGVFTSPNAERRWALYSLCGPLNWFGLI
jgi:hypothetical protein